MLCMPERGIEINRRNLWLGGDRAPNIKLDFRGIYIQLDSNQGISFSN